MFSKSKPPDTAECDAVSLGAEEYWEHGLNGFRSGGENLADGAWAVSFCESKRWSIRGAAVRLHGAARGVPVRRCATTLSSSGGPLCRYCTAIVGRYSYFHQSPSCNLSHSPRLRHKSSILSTLYSASWGSPLKQGDGPTTRRLLITATKITAPPKC